MLPRKVHWSFATFRMTVANVIANLRHTTLRCSPFCHGLGVLPILIYKERQLPSGLLEK